MKFNIRLLITVIGIPLYAYHWNTIKREGT